MKPGRTLRNHCIACILAVMISAACASTGLAQGKAAPSAGQAILEAIRITQPVAFCGEPVPLDEPDIRERMERELLVSLDNSDDVILWIKRANRYFPDIEKVLKAHSLPDDLKYITIAESSLRPLAFSNKGAVGYWQFIESTGTKYGLDITGDIDERRNVHYATQAAVQYLKKLYSIFGSWTLAAAAYNMGEDGLKSELLIQQVSDYYKLYLNQETQRYVFRILAAKIIMSNPARFGYHFKKDDLYRPRQTATVEIKAGQPVPLHVIAQSANTYYKIIKDLNPQIKLYHLPAGTHRLFIPKEAADGFPERYEKFVMEWNSAKNEYTYTVKKGDSLAKISGRFNVPLRALKVWNRLPDGKKIMPGDKLYIFSNDFKAANESVKTDPSGNTDAPEKTDTVDESSD